MRKRRTKEFWENHVLTWLQSGQNQSQYCRSSNLNQNAFSKWKLKLQNSNETTFVEIPFENSTGSESELELIIRNDYKIKINSDFDTELLKKLLAVLGESL
jgi:transposase-like protein